MLHDTLIQCDDARTGCIGIQQSFKFYWFQHSPVFFGQRSSEGRRARAIASAAIFS
jgi:hypothetical protein